MSGIHKRVEELERRLGKQHPEHPEMRPEMVEFLDRLATIKRDGAANEEEAAEYAAFERDLKAELKKREREGRIRGRGWGSVADGSLRRDKAGRRSL